MKHANYLILIACIFGGLLQATRAATYDVPNTNITLTYSILNPDNETVTVTDCNTGALGDLVIPGAIEGHPVTAIGDNAFSGCDKLTGVTIPYGVTTIADGTFSNCRSLTSASIPSSVSSIEQGAFDSCTSLTSVNIPDSVTSIGSNAFLNCRSLTSVIIPDSITTIGDEAFEACISLASVTIPDSVASIGSNAFSRCESLTSIDVAATNPNYASLEGVLFDKNITYLIQAPLPISGSYVIPDSVTTIGDEAFRFCRSLTSVTIPDSVVTIGNRAFQSCVSLTSVTISENVTVIGSSAFRYCSSLTSIHVAPTNPNYTSLDGVLFNKDLTTLIQAPGKISGAYTVPDSVTTIGSSAFHWCASLESVSFPDSVTTIGESAFSNCRSLTSATFSGNAPALFGHSVFVNAASGFTVYFYDDATGFTTPTWNGYTSEQLARPGGFLDWATTGGLSGDDALPDAVLLDDGLPNLLRYALGLQPMQLASSEHLPRHRIESLAGERSMIYEHRRRKGLEHAVSYKTSPDLAIPVEEWTLVSVTPTLVNSDTDGNGEVETVSVKIPAPDQQALFLIMEVQE